MKKYYPLCVLLILSSALSLSAHGIEEQIFRVSGSDSIEKTIEILGAQKGSSAPIVFKNGQYELKVEMESTPNKMLSVEFSPAHNFTPTSKDLFEKIEIKNTSDRINHEVIISDPKTGRIFHLNQELKVSKLDLVSPWEATNKLKPLKVILNEMNSTRIEKKSGKKK